ncbi:MAG: DUF2779 domain-containing protein [Caldilineaceae bacterium]|nr:DUF2779 domain-containing protein [Caldilineaceae bacterium]
MNTTPYLTKTLLLSARQCPKRLWLEFHAPDRLEPPSLTLLRRMQQGSEVGRLARARFPGGQLIAVAAARAPRATQAALARAATTLFEPAFVYDGVLVRCDILTLTAEGWHLIEVKAATSHSPTHLTDLAIQWYVLHGAGVEVARASIMHINSHCSRYPDDGELFVLADLTAEVRALQDEIPAWIAAARTVQAAAAEPAQPIGDHCQHPYPCPAQSYCWRDVPAASIFSIPRLGRQQRENLLSRGILRIDQIPAGEVFGASQQCHIDVIRRQEPYIDVVAIRRRLETLEYPLYFLDFEADSTPIPQFPDQRPYQAIPFQYSCHVLHADGREEHCEYLHTAASDPRLPLARGLVEQIGDTGSMVAYNAQYERHILLELAKQFPSYRLRLEQMAARLWDQMLIFRHDYIDPGFGGSASIKHVLPVLVPWLTYDELAVRRGDAAQAAWAELVASRDPQQRAELDQNLRAYCHRDTQAMLEIHKVLMRVVAQAETAAQEAGAGLVRAFEQE